MDRISRRHIWRMPGSGWSVSGGISAWIGDEIGGISMKLSKLRARHPRVVGAVIAGAVAWPIAGAVASPARHAQPARFGIHSGRDVFASVPVGYPPPGGIF